MREVGHSLRNSQLFEYCEVIKSTYSVKNSCKLSTTNYKLFWMISSTGGWVVPILNCSYLGKGEV